MSDDGSPMDRFIDSFVEPELQPRGFYRRGRTFKLGDSKGNQLEVKFAVDYEEPFLSFRIDWSTSQRILRDYYRRDKAGPRKRSAGGLAAGFVTTPAEFRDMPFQRDRFAIPLDVSILAERGRKFRQYLAAYVTDKLLPLLDAEGLLAFVESEGGYYYASNDERDQSIEFAKLVLAADGQLGGEVLSPGRADSKFPEYEALSQYLADEISGRHSSRDTSASEAVRELEPAIFPPQLFEHSDSWDGTLGLTGCFVLLRHENPTELPVFDEMEERYFCSVHSFSKNWALLTVVSDVALGPGLTDLVEAVVIPIAQQASSPTMLIYVIDSRCAVVQAYSNDTGGFRGVIGTSGFERFLADDDWEVDPRARTSSASFASRVGEWASASGLRPDTTALLSAIEEDRRPVEPQVAKFVRAVGLDRKALGSHLA